MEELLTTVYTKLKELNVKVFDKRPSSSTEYPFLIYRVEEPFVNVSPAIYTLVLNIWTENNSYEQVERLASEANDKLRDLSLSSEKLSIKFKKASEYRIEDPNKDIKRKEITYQLRVFEWNK